MLIYDFTLYPPVNPTFSMQFQLKFAFEHSVNPLIDLSTETQTLQEIITSALYVPYQTTYDPFVETIMDEIKTLAHLSKPINLLITIKPNNDIIEYSINS